MTPNKPLVQKEANAYNQRLTDSIILARNKRITSRPQLVIRRVATAATPVADKIDRAAHVDIHKICIDVLLQQLRAPCHGICVAATDLHTGTSMLFTIADLQMYLAKWTHQKAVSWVRLCMQHLRNEELADQDAVPIEVFQGLSLTSAESNLPAIRTG